MEVIVKSSPKIEIELATKVVKVGEGSRVDIDSALSTTSENPVMNKVITAELSSLSESVVSLESEVVRIGDYSPTNKVGTADDLAGRGESVPAEFGFRASGGKSIKDGRAYIKRIKGNSVVWNQLLLQTNNYTESGVTSSWNDNICTLSGESSGTYINITSKRIPCSLNEKWALIAEQISNPNDVLFKIGLFNSSNGRAILGNGVTSSAIIINGDYASNGSGFGVDYFGGVGTDLTGIQFKVKIISLTKMFQAGNEPTTIEEYNARKPIVEDEYAYNEGQVIHCNTESIKSVGDNAWDEEWELGTFNTTTGEDITRTDQIRSKNLIKILPNEQYHFGGNGEMWIIFYDANKNVIDSPSGASSGNSIYKAAGERFTTPSNAAFMKFYLLSNYGTTYNHDIMISLVHSGWKQDTDAGYQPYWQDTLPLPIIRKYFPQGMKSAGSAHDEIRYKKSSGKWEAVQRIGSVDMGSMAWSYDSANQVFTSYTIMDLMTHPAEVSERNKGLLCSKYSPSSTYIASTMDDKSWLRIPKSVTIKDSSYTDAAIFKADMAGVILYYELAEPIVTELDAEDQNFRDYYQVADFGTEQSQSSVPSAAFSADIIYQFNAVDMIREHELEITELQKVIATMQAQLTSLINGGQ